MKKVLIMRGWFMICFLIMFSVKLPSMSGNYELEFNIKIPTELCDYSGLLSGAKSENDRNKREEAYKKLLGVAKGLGDLRSNYIANGDLIDLFPTVYYHMTVLEMDEIRKGSFNYPLEKMRQMLYFYDAYLINRARKQTNLVEEHWKRHFQKVESAGTYDFCQSMKDVLNSAIRAHVRFDLGRAIKFAYSKRDDPSITPSMLLGEFEETNKVFPKAQLLALKDIKKVSACGYLSWLNVKILGGIPTSEVIEWRTKAFKDAIINPIELLGYDGKKLIAQPSKFPHTELLNTGENVCGKNSTTLFLFDLSGSMKGNGANSNKSKLQQAKDASKQTLLSLANSNMGSTPEVGVLGFSGGCVADPTRVVSDFDTDLTQVESRINGMGAGGGTPLAEAIAASKCKLANYLAQNGQDKGKLIVLSDGQATCQTIRPSGVYNSGQLGQQIVTVSANNCGGANINSLSVKYYTIGFNIAPGSPAERDLQYLAQISGGKYLNVQSQTQLERAFRKFNRTYIPKPSPTLSNLPSKASTMFGQGVSQINAESYPEALETYQSFSEKYKDDCHGAYNLALMLEANDFYKKAILAYQKYLSLCPNANDKKFVENQIQFLEEEFKQFLLFQKKVVMSDLEYLKLHFEKIQNGESVALAYEFKGFLKEKGTYYVNLPELMGRSDRLFKSNSKEVANGLKNCARLIKKNPKTWDRDATPVLSMTYLNLETLLESF